MKPELVKLVSLCSNKERLHAYEVARYLRRGDNEAAYGIMGLFAGNPQFLKLVLDAYKDAASWEPTTFRRRQIEAYSAAYHLAGRTGKGFDWTARPTLGQWKDQFRTLFTKAKLPTDMTFRRTSTELGLPLAKERTGRPKGSRDSKKRTRRKNWLKKRRP